MAKPKTRKKEQTLTQALAAFLDKTLLPNLAERAAQPDVRAALSRQYQSEKAAERTADTLAEWQARLLQQVGAAWVLSCVFIRTLEDRGLLARCRIAGDGAQDSEQQFFELAPSLSARDYLLTVFKEIGSLPGAEALLGPGKNPAFRLGPSADAARALLELFRSAGEDGALRFRFEGEDTRFLGDLYQDLSEEVRKRYALLQTPRFIERFILDQTLDPAIAEFGLEAVRMIDPTCGSGHLLLGSFERLLERRLQVSPGLAAREHALAALEQVYGVDLNPYAIAISRFRLTLAFLKAAGIGQLAQAPKLPLNLVVADSLLLAPETELHLFEQDELDEATQRAFGDGMFVLADQAGARKVFGQKYHAVVGNPPYITCKDEKLRAKYRQEYSNSASGKYALSAPFTERFFQLAVDGGYVGMINANSFMKREFGKGLIEKVLPQYDLSRVIDSSGAYIPGHGTPTVLLFGRRRAPVSDSVAVVLGKRGEPSTPADAEQALVWSSIREHYAEIGFENDYLSVAEVPRATLSTHPWSLGGGGAAELKELLEERAEKRLGDLAAAVGVMVVVGTDDVLLAETPEIFLRHGVPGDCINSIVVGENIRDWSASTNACIYMHNADGSFRPNALVDRYLWPYRTVLRNYRFFGKTKDQRGLDWREMGAVLKDKLRTPLSIAFAFVATHNHFVLDRGGKVFKQTAPIIKLPDDATEVDHLALLAYLNSSTACFWMKQVIMVKGLNHSSDANSTPFLAASEFTGSALKALPLPNLGDSAVRDCLAAYGRALTELASQRAGLSWKDVLSGDHQIDDGFKTIVAQRDAVLRTAIWFQEELDWYVYWLFRLAPYPEKRLATTGLELGQRAFELRLARMGAEHSDYAWFERHGLDPQRTLSTPSAIANERCRLIDESPILQLLEKPEQKRRWRQISGKAGQELETDEMVLRKEALAWVEGIVEGVVGTAGRIVSVRSVADEVLEIPKVESTARWLRPDIDPKHSLASLAEDNAISQCVAQVFNESGIAKHRLWQREWARQRGEASGGGASAPSVLPRYQPEDFAGRGAQLRGPLDVPKERFISYPGCEKDGDPSLLIGWAGWNHLQRAQALTALYQERKNEDGWPADRLTPMLVGLFELMPWLNQWHSAPEAGSDNPARDFEQFLQAELRLHSLTEDDLVQWRPQKNGKKGKKR